MFFKTIRKVGKYKDFVPWCKDSWETNSSTASYSYEDLIITYPVLQKNKNALRIIQAKYKNTFKSNEFETNKLMIKTFNGGIKVGFNILDFSYNCHVLAIEPNIILSTTDDTQSNIFKNLESLYVLESLNSENIKIDYNLNFEFKSILFANVTNLFLNFIGENIMKAFIAKCELEKFNIDNSQDMISDSEFDEFVDNKLQKISFDSLNDKIEIKNLLNKMYLHKKITTKDTELLLKLFRYNKTILSKFIFLSENVIWNNIHQINKIKYEIARYLH